MPDAWRGLEGAPLPGRGVATLERGGNERTHHPEGDSLGGLYGISFLMQQDPKTCPAPNDLIESLCQEAKARFVEETGLTGKATIELRIPAGDWSSFVAHVVVSDEGTGEQRSYDVLVRATPATRHLETLAYARPARLNAAASPSM